MNHFAVLCLLIVLVIVKGQKCQAMLDIPGMESGVVEFKQLNSLNKHKDPNQISFSHYTIQLQHPIPNNKAIFSLSSINAQTSTLDLFDLTINSITDSQITITFIYQHTKWNQVSYIYLITNRTQEIYLQMTTFSEKDFHLFYDQNDYDKSDGISIIMKASTLLERVLTQPVWEYKVLGFVRGLKYKNEEMKPHSLSTSISNPTLTKQTIQIDIISLPEQQHIKLQLLSVSFIYFNPKQLTFVPFGGLVTRTNFIGSLQIDILDLDLPGKLFAIYGISSVNLQNSNDGFAIDSDINEKFFFNMWVSKTMKKMDFTYFVIGLDASSVCYLCEQEKYLSGKYCVQKCESNQTIYQFQNSSQLACIKTQNIKIQNTSIEQKSKPQMQTNQNQHINIQVQSQPLQTQQQQSVQINQQLSSFKQISSSSQQQPPDIINQSYQHNSINDQKVLKQTSTPPSIDDNHVNHQINYCKHVPNSYWTGESCQCKVGYVMNLGYCHQIIQQSFTHHLNYQTTTNQPKQTYIHSQQPKQTHVQNITQFNQQEKPHNKSQNQQATLKTFCHSNLQIYNQLTKKCQCINGLSYMQDQSTHSLSCVDCRDFAGFFSQDGTCKYCGQNKIYDSQQLKCRCADSYRQIQSGQCVQKANQIEFSYNNNQVSQQSSIAVTEQHENDKNSQIITNTNVETNTNSSLQQNKQLQNTQNPGSKINNNYDMQQQTQTMINNQSQSTIEVSENNISQYNYGQGIPQITSRIISQSVSLPINQSKEINQHKDDYQMNKNTNIPITNSENIDKSIQSNINTISNIPQDIQNIYNQHVQNPQTLSNSSSNLLQGPTQENILKSQNCIKLLSTPQLNTANLFLTLELSTQITFQSEQQMRNFLQSQFTPSIYQPSSIYCNQQQENKKVFECLLIYTSGIPNQKFQIRFWYLDQQRGEECQLKIPVDPLQLAAKSVRTSRKRL